MFGDDLDPTVTTDRFGFGQVSDTGEGSMHGAKRFEWSDNKRTVGLRKVKEARKKRQQLTATSFYENM